MKHFFFIIAMVYVVRRIHRDTFDLYLSFYSHPNRYFSNTMNFPLAAFSYYIKSHGISDHDQHNRLLFEQRRPSSFPQHDWNFTKYVNDDCRDCYYHNHDDYCNILYACTLIVDVIRSVSAISMMFLHSNEDKERRYQHHHHQQPKSPQNKIVPHGSEVTSLSIGNVTRLYDGVGIRVMTLRPWIWYSTNDCSDSNTSLSTMKCYFPEAEPECSNDTDASASELHKLPSSPSTAINMTRRLGFPKIGRT